MFTLEELQIIRKFLIESPIQGNFQTLPTLMEKIAIIIRKLDDLANTEQLKAQS